MAAKKKATVKKSKLAEAENLKAPLVQEDLDEQCACGRHRRDCNHPVGYKKPHMYAIQVIDETGRIVKTMPMSLYPNYRLLNGLEDLQNLAIDLEDAILNDNGV